MGVEHVVGPAGMRAANLAAWLDEQAADGWVFIGSCDGQPVLSRTKKAPPPPPKPPAKKKAKTKK